MGISNTRKKPLQLQKHQDTEKNRWLASRCPLTSGKSL